MHLPTVKTHMYTTTTGAMKNAFGGLLSKYRHYTHTWIHETLVDLLAIQKEIHPGIFAVMDGTTAGNGPGPRLMEPVVKNVILASADQVAIDAVAAKLMGFDPLSIKYIRLAHEHGLGVGDVREIELVGDDVSGENWGFQVGYSTHTFLAWLSWYGPTQVFQKLLFRTPLVVVPTFIGEVEQDYMYWPLKFKRVAEQWRVETTWGQLFQQYQREGCLVRADNAVGVGAQPFRAARYDSRYASRITQHVKESLHEQSQHHRRRVCRLDGRPLGDDRGRLPDRPGGRGGRAGQGQGARSDPGRPDRRPRDRCHRHHRLWPRPPTPIS